MNKRKHDTPNNDGNRNYCSLSSVSSCLFLRLVHVEQLCGVGLGDVRKEGVGSHHHPHRRSLHLPSSWSILLFPSSVADCCKVRGGGSSFDGGGDGCSAGGSGSGGDIKEIVEGRRGVSCGLIDELRKTNDYNFTNLTSLKKLTS